MRHKIGDRVEIVALDHPWLGSTGVIVAELRVEGLAWSVQLDDHDHRAGVADDEIRGVV